MCRPLYQALSNTVSKIGRVLAFWSLWAGAGEWGGRQVIVSNHTPETSTVKEVCQGPEAVPGGFALIRESRGASGEAILMISSERWLRVHDGGGGCSRQQGQLGNGLGAGGVRCIEELSMEGA